VAEHPDDVLLEAVALRPVRDGAARAGDGVAIGASGELPERLTEADEPRHHEGVARERPARGIDRGPGARGVELHRLAEDELLDGRRRAELDDVHVGRFAEACHDERPLRRESRSGAAGEVAAAEGLQLDALVDAVDPRGAVAQLLRLLLGGEDEADRTLADGWEVALPQRLDGPRGLREVLGARRLAELRVRVARTRRSPPGREPPEIPVGRPGARHPGTRLERRLGRGVETDRGPVRGVALELDD